MVNIFNKFIIGLSKAIVCVIFFCIIYFSLINKNYFIFAVNIIAIILGRYLFKFLKRCTINISQRKIDICFVFSVLLFVLLQIIFIRIFNILPRWDVGWIYNMASTLNRGEPLEIEQLKYLYYYRHNYPLLVVYQQIFKLFGSHMIKLYYLGSFSIGLSICILYATFRRNFSTKSQLIGMILVFSFLPLLMYCIIPYSDVLALPFSVASIFVIYRDGRIHYDLKSILFFSLLVALGCIFKVLLMIFAIAYAILGICRVKTFRKIGIVAPFIFVFIFSSIFGSFIDSQNYSYAKYKQSGITPFYYMYIGMNEDSNGRYNEEDYLDSLKWGIRLDTKEKNEVKDYYVEGIISRIENMGITGFFNFIGRKTYETWGDGSLQMIEYLQTEPYNSNAIRTFFVDGLGTIILRVIWQMVYLFLLIGLWIGTKRKEPANIMFYLIFLGFFTYLSLFEAGPRYLLLFLPILILINTKNFEEFNV